MIRKPALLCDGEAGCKLQPGGAQLQKFGGIAARKNAAGGDNRNLQIFLGEERNNFQHDLFQVVVLPIKAESQVSPGKRTFNDYVVGITVCFACSAKEKVQRPG